MTMSDKMRKVQVSVTRVQKSALEALSRRTGKSQSELIREGLEGVITKAAKEKPDWRAATSAAAGIWADRANRD